jgi:hypothetical protein
VTFFLDVFSILKSSSVQGRFYFWKQPHVARGQIRGLGWVLHLSKQFLGHKLLDRERLISWSFVMAEKPNAMPKFRPISTHLKFVLLFLYLNLVAKP